MLTNTKPLLLVDDDLTNQDLLSRRLKRAGYATEVAGSGYEALDVLARRGVELVLLDSMMPGPSGIELLRQLRPIGKGPATPPKWRVAVTKPWTCSPGGKWSWSCWTA